MDQTGPEFFMKLYSGSGWSQGRIIFPCQTGLGRKCHAAGAVPQVPRRQVRAAKAAAGEP
jgi:hypothetical protein